MEFYALFGVDQTPKKIRSTGESHEFYCYFPPPLPEVVVVFCLQWPERLTHRMGIQLFLDSNSNSICKDLGFLSEENKALCFKGDWEKEEKTISDEIQEKGRLIKLLIAPESSLCDEPDSQDSGVSNLMHTSVQIDGSDAEYPDIENSLATAPTNGEKKLTSNSSPLVESKQTPKNRGISVKRKSTFEFEDDDEEECSKHLKTEKEMESSEKQNKGTQNETSMVKEKKQKAPGNAKDFFKPRTKTSRNKNANHLVAKSPATTGLQELKVPSPRWGHSFCKTRDNKAIVIGGQGIKNQMCKDSMWQFDSANNSWARIEDESNGASRRMGHTATYDEKSRQMYVFGGSKNKKWYSDIHTLDTETMTWNSIEVTGKAPVRAYHSCTVVNEELLIFGGVFPNPDPIPDGCSNDVHFFSTVSNSWYQPIVSGEKPTARSGHSACLIDGLLYIFGGWDAPTCFNDLWTLDIGLMSFKKVETTGQVPSPRSWHGAALSSDLQSLVIYGGYNGDVALNDLHVLKIGSLQWSRLADQNLTARAGHQLLNFSSSTSEKEKEKMLVFGGGNNDGDFYNDTKEMEFKHRT
eukprot:Seg406.3 transcript_id=Seg406.3/GoldUCD/mRNA.D3Y31 product="RING finger protein B" protein_id=Seg406.3/GoldUCD/D3Y31